jgi:hypothetical protein
LDNQEPVKVDSDHSMDSCEESKVDTPAKTVRRSSRQRVKSTAIYIPAYSKPDEEGSELPQVNGGVIAPSGTLLKQREREKVRLRFPMLSTAKSQTSFPPLAINRLMQTPIPSHRRGEVAVPSPPYRKDLNKYLPRHAQIPSPKFERKSVPQLPVPTRPRLRSLSFSAVEEYLTISFRQVVPIAGAPTQWEKTKQQEATNGVDSMATILRRKAKSLARKELLRGYKRGGRVKGARNPLVNVIGRHNRSRSHHFSRAGSLPPVSLDFTESALNRASAAEEAPLSLQSISELPAIDVVVPWAVDTSLIFPLRPVLGSG